MKNAAKDSRKMEMVGKLPGTIGETLSLFNELVIIEKSYSSQKKDDYDQFIILIKKLSSEMIAVSEDENQRANIQQYTDEIIKLAEHKLINQQFDNNFDLYDYFQIHDDTDNDINDYPEISELNCERLFPREYEIDKNNDVWWF